MRFHHSKDYFKIISMKPQLPENTKILRSEYPRIKELLQTKTLQVVANEYGVSRERIRQIITRFYGIKLRHREKKEFSFTCVICNKKWTYFYTLKKPSLICAGCINYHNRYGSYNGILRKFNIIRGKCIICHKNPVRSSGLCNACLTARYYKTEKGKEKAKIWKENNKDKIREYRRKNILKNKERYLLRHREYYQRNKLKYLQKVHKYYEAHKDIINAKAKERYLKNKLKNQEV